MKKTFVASLLAIGALVAHAAYVQITPATAYASTSYGGRSPEKAFNGSGLSDGLHGTDAGTMWMGSGSAVPGQWWLVDLGDTYPLGRIKIWNFNQSSYANRGLRSVDILVATASSVLVNGAPDFTDTSTWTTLLDDVTIPQAPGTAGYAGEDPITLETPTQAQWVAISINTGWGGGYGGLSEVQFFEAPNHTLVLSGITASTASSVTLAGRLNSLDGTSGNVGIVYGATDGGEDFSAWDSVAWIGSTAPGDFTATLSNLAADTAYCAAFVVANGSDYAFSESVEFMTGILSVSAPNPFYENDPGQKSIVFSRPASCSGLALDFQYTLSGDAAADYAATLSGSATFPAGETFVSVPFTPVNDTATTGARTVTVAITPSPSYLTDATSAATFTVLDDESAPSATSYAWSGEGGDQHWDTAANWSPNGVPTLLDTATIDSLASTNAPVLSSRDDSAYRLRIGYESGTVGALAIAPGRNFTVRTETSIGRAGLGALTIGEGADFLSANTPATLGDTATGVGVATIDGAFRVTNGKNLVIGNAGTGELVIGPNGSVTVSVNGQSGRSYIGNAATGVGTIRIDGGSYSPGYTCYFGEKGTGTFIVNSGTVSGDRDVVFGNSAGSHGFFEMNGGSMSMGRGELQLGNAGEGAGLITGGDCSPRGVSLGIAATGSGVLRLEGGTLRPNGNYSIYVGKSGIGTLLMRGGSVSAASSYAALYVRQNADGTGLVHGWGNYHCGGKGGVNNNGKIVASGKDADEDPVERTLSLAVSNRDSGAYPGGFLNTIENDADNGWYAVDKGLLSVSLSDFSLDAGGDRVQTWGEAIADDAIDLVNSARIYYTNVTAKISTQTWQLYAPDRSDVPTLTTRGNIIGIWKFTANGTFDSFDLEVRYDATAAGSNIVHLYRYDETAAAWQPLATTELSGHRLLASGLAPQGSAQLGFFMAAAFPRPTVLLLQ